LRLTAAVRSATESRRASATVMAAGGGAGLLAFLAGQFATWRWVA
jgi:hypothetical protein